MSNKSFCIESLFQPINGVECLISRILGSIICVQGTPNFQFPEIFTRSLMENSVSNNNADVRERALYRDMCRTNDGAEKRRANPILKTTSKRDELFAYVHRCQCAVRQQLKLLRVQLHSFLAYDRASSLFTEISSRAVQNRKRCRSLKK